MTLAQAIRRALDHHDQDIDDSIPTAMSYEELREKLLSRRPHSGLPAKK